MELEQTIRKYVLKNAILHDGKAQAGAIVGKLIAEDPGIKSKMKDVMPVIAKIVKEVNNMSVKSQTSELEKIAPEMLEKKEAEEKKLPPLPDAIPGKVVVRYPPEPNGYLHLGNSMSFFINRIYADEYKGKVWLRFEDTDPTKEKKEYYAAIKESLKWLGLGWDFEKNISDDLPVLYQHAEKLIKKGDFYVCTCLQDEIKRNRAAGKPCSCRKRTPDLNLELWKKMHNELPAGTAIVRFKGDMESPNMDIRDPVMLRIVTASHPIQGTKYRVWPTYDFAGSIEDHVCGITHVMRSAEFEQRAILQSMIRKSLGYNDPTMITYSRFELEGTPMSKRKLLALIEKKVVSGWDDPRLSTVYGLRRRGILPDTFRELAILVGPTKGAHTIEWSMLLTINRRFLDPISNRYLLVKEPVKLVVEGAPTKKAVLDLHPDFPDRGKREVPATGIFFIEKSDVEGMKKGAVFRLKELYNVKVTSIGKEVKGKFAGNEKIDEVAKIHWVPEDSVPVDLVVPDILLKGEEFNPDSLKKYQARAEKALADLPEGTLIQMVRLGFGRIDSSSPLTIIFTSK